MLEGEFNFFFVGEVALGICYLKVVVEVRVFASMNEHGSC